MATHGIMNLDTTIAYACLAMRTEQEAALVNKSTIKL